MVATKKQTAVIGSNITGQEKKRENEHFDYYITLRRRRLMNLLFLLLKNEALS